MKLTARFFDIDDASAFAKHLLEGYAIESSVDPARKEVDFEIERWRRVNSKALEMIAHRFGGTLGFPRPAS